MNLTTPGEHDITLQGLQGALEGRWQCPATLNSETVLIICHPHSLYGGSMNNKVVTSIARAARDLGLRSLRFNMRGVGHSEGEFAHGQGECDDLLAIIAWLSEQPSVTQIALAGFSFGSYVSYAAACQTPVEFLISVAPPVARFPFQQHHLSATPWLVIQGDEDDVVAPAAVYDWIATLSSPPQLQRMPTAGHFFHGQLLELRQIVTDFYQQHHAHDA
jgi:alpha/beta superfamily hydrolase